jgi:hypothetical protein
MSPFSLVLSTATTIVQEDAKIKDIDGVFLGDAFYGSL